MNNGDTLALEWEFNKQAGFTEEDDLLPEFFYDEALEPTGRKARHRPAAINETIRELMAAQGS